MPQLPVVPEPEPSTSNASPTPITTETPPVATATATGPVIPTTSAAATNITVNAEFADTKPALTPAASAGHNSTVTCMHVLSTY